MYFEISAASADQGCGVVAGLRDLLAFGCVGLSSLLKYVIGFWMLVFMQLLCAAAISSAQNSYSVCKTCNLEGLVRPLWHPGEPLHDPGTPKSTREETLCPGSEFYRFGAYFGMP